MNKRFIINYDHPGKKTPVKTHISYENTHKIREMTRKFEKKRVKKKF